MFIEIRRNKMFIDGKETTESIFSEKKYTNMRVLDFRTSDLKNIDNITILNKSGRNYNLISINDWNCTLRTSQEVNVKKGFIPYMSQTSVS